VHIDPTVLEESTQCIARDHLAIPATSAASESDIITKKRNKLGAGNTRRLLYLRNWGVLEEGVDDSSDNEPDPDEAGIRE
jgi:hypothetical protein